MNGRPLHLQAGPPWRLQIKYHHGLGDTISLTAAVESLHRAYPGEYLTDVDTTFPDLWANSPRVSKLSPHLCQIVNMGHPPRGPRLVDWLTADLGERVGKPIPMTSGPAVYLTADERDERYRGTEDIGPYVVINASRQECLSAKYPGHRFWQAVTDHLRGVCAVVQVGTGEQPRLTGAVDLVGKTSVRDLCRVVHHATAGAGGETFLNHLSAALNRPFVCVAGGRCGPDFPAYPTTVVLSSVGKLDCCRAGGCWVNEVHHPVRPGACVLPVIESGEVVPKCLSLIEPDAVAWELARHVLEK